MFGNSRGAEFTAPSSAAVIRLRRRSASETALVAAQALFVGLTAALFFAWLTGASGSGRAGEALSFGTDCYGSGRGALCVSRSGENEASELVPDCASLGRGGIVCESAANDGTRTLPVSAVGPLAR